MCVCFHFIKNVPLFVDTPPFRGLMKQNKCRMESVELGHFRARREAIVVTPAGGGACGHRGEGCPLGKSLGAGPSVRVVVSPGPQEPGGILGQVKAASRLLSPSLDSRTAVPSSAGSVWGLPRGRAPRKVTPRSLGVSALRPLPEGLPHSPPSPRGQGGTAPASQSGPWPAPLSTRTRRALAWLLRAD